MTLPVTKRRGLTATKLGRIDIPSFGGKNSPVRVGGIAKMAGPLKRVGSLWTWRQASGFFKC
jgi:hypothetical protein